MGSNKESLLELNDFEQEAFYPDLIENNLVQPRIFADKADAHIGRVYYERQAEEHKRNYFYSVTTIIDVIDKGKGFAMWLGNSLSYDHAMEFGNKAATTGNIVHALIMYLLWGEEVDTKKGFYDVKTSQVVPIGNAVKKRLLGFFEFYNELQPRILATELSLYNNRKYRNKHIYPFAGQADIIADLGGVKWLIDVKTGKEYKQPHELQLTAYKILWDSLFGNEYGKIDILACLYLPDGWRKKPTYKLKQYNFVPDEWYNTYDMFCYVHGDKDGKVPEPKFKRDFPNIYKLDQNNKESNNEKPEPTSSEE